MRWVPGRCVRVVCCRSDTVPRSSASAPPGISRSPRTNVLAPVPRAFTKCTVRCTSARAGSGPRFAIVQVTRTDSPTAGSGGSAASAVTRSDPPSAKPRIASASGSPARESVRSA